MGDENVCLNKIIHVEEKAQHVWKRIKVGWGGGGGNGGIHFKPGRVERSE